MGSQGGFRLCLGDLPIVPASLPRAIASLPGLRVWESLGKPPSPGCGAKVEVKKPNGFWRERLLAALPPLSAHHHQALCWSCPAQQALVHPAAGSCLRTIPLFLPCSCQPRNASRTLEYSLIPEAALYTFPINCWAVYLIASTQPFSSLFAPSLKPLQVEGRAHLSCLLLRQSAPSLSSKL